MMRFQLYIQGMNGKAWVKLANTFAAEQRGDTWVISTSEGGQKVRGGNVVQPIGEDSDGNLLLLTRSGSIPCVETSPDGGFFVQTKRLADGSLQYVRRTGHVGIAPAEAQHAGGDPEVGQWREHPGMSSKTEFVRGGAEQVVVSPKDIKEVKAEDL